MDSRSRSVQAIVTGINVITIASDALLTCHKIIFHHHHVSKLRLQRKNQSNKCLTDNLLAMCNTSFDVTCSTNTFWQPTSRPPPQNQ
jgi:hypothetical protein